MKIHKALKIKNRLAGEVTRLQDILRRENCRRNDSTSKIDCKDVLDQLNGATRKLINVKSALAKASAPISEDLSLLAELKNQITFLKTLPIRSDKEVQFIGRNDEKLEYQWTSFIDQENLDGRINSIQQEINAIQDEIDEFNATAEVAYSE